MCGICIQNWLFTTGTSVASLAFQINRPIESLIRWIACRNRPRPAARDAIFRVTGVTFPTRFSASSCRCHRQLICPGVVPIPGSLGQFNRAQAGNVQPSAALAEPVASEASHAPEEAPTDDERDDDEHQPEVAHPSPDDCNAHYPGNGTAEGLASTGNGNGSHACQAGESRLSSAELYRRSDEALNLAAELHSLAAELQAQGL